MIGFPTAEVLERLPRGSDARVAGLIFLRALGRELYGPCPLVRDRLGDGADAVLQRFLDACAASRSAMDWRLHLEFGAYCGVSDAQLWDELCTAAVRRWVRAEVTLEAWIALRAAVVPGRVFVGQKARGLEQGPRYLTGRMTGPELRSRFAYQTGVADFDGVGLTWTAYEPVLGATGLVD